MKVKIILVIGVFMLLSGCKTCTKDTYERIYFKEDGKTITHIENGILETEQSPFHNKAVRAEGSFIGMEMTVTDPQTGNMLPSVKILDGAASAGSMPVTSGKPNVTETFGTYREVFRYEKSFWPWSTAISQFTYDRVAGGEGVDTEPSLKGLIIFNPQTGNTQIIPQPVNKSQIEDTKTNSQLINNQKNNQ